MNEINILFGKPVDSTFDSVVPQSLLLSRSEDYSKHLVEKRDLILQSLTPILSNLQPTASESDDLKLLQSQVSELSSQISAVKIENERLKDEREELEQRLTSATFKFLSAEKKMERLKSSTLAKIERSTVAVSQVKREESVDDKPDTEKKNTSEVDEEALNRIKKESEAIIQKQSEELKSLQSKLLSLHDELAQANLKFAALTEADVSNSEPYKTLKLRYIDLSSRANHLESLNDIIKQESEKLSSERTEYRELVAAEYKAMADELEGQMKRLENDLIRIRAARDDLASEIAIRKAKEESRISILNEITELSETRASRVKALEMEVESLKSQMTTNGVSSSSAVLTAEDTPEKLLARIEKLEKQNQFLSAELPEMEAAFNKAHSLSIKKIADVSGREEKIARLAAEKTKADQKYFAAMRSKEAVTAENKTLKTQSLKSTEIIQQLREAERTVLQKVTFLEKQLAELENARHTYQKQVQETQRKINEQNVTIESYKGQMNRLSAELQTRATTLLNESESRRSVELQLERAKAELERFKDEKSKSSSLGRLNGDDSQIEALRSIAICSVCSKNWKDTVIKVCGHCFCMECAKDRLNARLRKCPLCNKQYSHNDLISVHL